MQAFIIWLTQTKSGAIVEMLFILFSSAIIVGIALQLYSKLYYIKLLKATQLETDHLKNQNINLCAEKSSLQKCLREKNNKIIRLFKEVEAHNSEIVHIRIEGKKSVPPNNTEDKNGIFYYNKLGLVHKEQVINLTQIKGIGLWVEEKQNFDVYTIYKINKLVPIDIENIKKESDVLSSFQINWPDQIHILAKKQLNQVMN